MADDDKPDDKPTTTATDDDGTQDKTLGPAGEKALAEERKARRDAEKQAKELADRLQAIEDKDKSEVERLTEQVATLTKERDGAVAKADRLEVSILKSLDEDQAKRITSAARRLTGTTREELEEDADEFLSAFAPPTAEPRPTPTGKPQERLKPGSGDPDVPAEETDIKALGARMFSN